MDKISYKNSKLVRSSYEEILKVIRPGDVVNQDNATPWYELWSVVGHWAIRRYQRHLFGKAANWRDTHTMIFFDEWATFSVELPKARIKPLHDYCLSNMSIYRFQLTELTKEHLEIMMEAADQMIGTGYDIGQLLDIGLRGLLGYDQDRPLQLFDWGKKKKVCSVGVRICYEYLYQKAIKPAVPNPRPGKWLFYALNPAKWPPDKVAAYHGTDVEATAPAHFANSDYFQNEFELVARFKDGQRVG